MLKQVIWIDQTKFICKLVEDLLKERGVACHTLESLSDFSYLLTDLRPELLICDLKTINQDLGQFKNQVKDYNGKVVTTASLADYERFNDFKFFGLIEKPLDVEKLYDQILDFSK